MVSHMEIENMNFKKYQEGAERTFADSPSTINPYQLSELHCVIGISTEAAELLDAYKKHIYYGKPLDVVNISEEIGDVMWYVANLCRLLNFDIEKILDTNLQKLKLRYPDKFDSEKAINRDLDAERNLLSEKLEKEEAP